jgi:hypothetical protein
MSRRACLRESSNSTLPFARMGPLRMSWCIPPPIRCSKPRRFRPLRSSLVPHSLLTSGFGSPWTTAVRLRSLRNLPERQFRDWDTIVGGVTRVGTHADVELQAEFYRDIKQAAATALATTKVGEEMNPLDKDNPWALFDNYIDRVAAQCVNTLTPKWSAKLAGYDVFIWDQCYSMEQTLRID